MCGRYYLELKAKNIQMLAIFEEAARRQRLLTGQETLSGGEVFPGMTVAALAMGKSGQGAYPMRWGFARSNGGGLLINVRSESAMKKFEASMLNRRCLIPMSWYFEWQAQEDARNKIKYAIWPRKAEPAYLAGIYRYEEGQKLPALSILTREAAPGIAFIHPRMPVIFSESLREPWLMGKEDPGALLDRCETDMACRMEEGAVCRGL